MAGHIDHGKSTLLRSLTGMEPARLEVEKRRGMTIDLGFVWATVDGEDLSFVDVPGHTRYLGNALTGLAAAEAVLFVVNAREGWKAQSTEHLAVANALGISHGVLAVTFSDSASPASATAQSLSHINATSLAGIEAVAVSAVSGAGMVGLSKALGRMARTIPPRHSSGDIRIWIDRSFTIQGTGTVVTGTLFDGTISSKDHLSLNGEPVRLRSLQSQRTSKSQISGPARIALNLRSIAAKNVVRGDVLTTPGAWCFTELIDVEIVRPPRTGIPPLEKYLPSTARFCIGSCQVQAHLRPLGDNYARIALSRALPIRHGDRAVLRIEGHGHSILGISVLDVAPPPLNRRGSAVARATELEALFGGQATVLDHLRRLRVVPKDFFRRIGVELHSTDPVQVVGDWFVYLPLWMDWSDRLKCMTAKPTTDAVANRLGFEEARQLLSVPDVDLMQNLVAAVGCTTRDGLIFSAANDDSNSVEASIQALELRFRQNPLTVLSHDEIVSLNLGTHELNEAHNNGRVLFLGSSVVMSPSAIPAALHALRGLGGPFTTSQARKLLEIPRRAAIPLLEEMDRRGETVRTGDLRRITGTTKVEDQLGFR